MIGTTGWRDLSHLTFYSAGGGTLTARVVDQFGRSYEPIEFTIDADTILAMADVVTATLAWPDGADLSGADLKTLRSIEVVSAPTDLHFNWSSTAADPLVSGELLEAGDLLGPFDSSASEASSGAAIASASRRPSPGCNASVLFSRALRLYANATAGTWTLTFGGTTTAAIAWNAVGHAYSGGNSVREKIQAALNTHGQGWRVFVTHGPWPQAGFTLTFFNPDPRLELPTITTDASSLTAVGGIVRTKPMICQDGSAMGINLRGEQILSGADAVNGGGYVPAPTAGQIAVGGSSWSFEASGTGSAPYGIWNIEDRSGTDVPYDFREMPACVEFYNPLGNVHAVTLAYSFSNTGTTNLDHGFTMNPGYQECIMDARKQASTTVDLSAIKSMRVTGSAHSGAGYFDKDDLCKFHVGAVSRLGKAGGRTTISIIFDDHLASTFVTYRYLFRRYAHVPIGMAIVQDWAVSGSRNTGANPPGGAVLTTAQLVELAQDPQFDFYTHSKSHYRYGTGRNPASVAATAQDQSIEWASNVTPAGGTTFTLTIPGVGTTGNIAYNANTKTVGAALVALLGPDSVESVDFGFTAASTLGSQTSMRIRFAQAQPIMTVAITAGTANSIVCGPSFTVAEIRSAYMDPAAWFRGQGVPCKDDIWVLPQGNVSPAVIEAANSAGVRMIRLADSMGGTSDFGNHRFAATDVLYRTVPTRSIASGGDINLSFEGLIQEILYAVHYGRSMCLMGHALALVGGAVDILTTDWILLMEFLTELENAGLITLMRASEQVDHLEAIAA